MNRKLVLVVTLTIVIIGMLGVTFRVQRAEAPSGAIIINADGSVDPPTANIMSTDNVTYTFTDNINDAIVVERSHIIIDGDGYTLDGSGTGEQIGIKVEYVADNVTIQNMNIIDFVNGIGLISCDQNKILGNNITNNTNGIWLSESMNNTISGNTIANNANGIFLDTVNFTNFSENTITNNYYGIWIEKSAYDNKFYHNYFVNNPNQVYVAPGNPNAWDDGYPSGGNYWSDYEERYPNATEIDDSGIWDTPYIIDVNNQDNYPLVPEFPTWTSMLLILIGLTFSIAIYNRRPIH